MCTVHIETKLVKTEPEALEKGITEDKTPGGKQVVWGSGTEYQNVF